MLEPIFVNANDRFENDSIKNWNFRKADWIKFENLCSEDISVEIFENQADPIKKFTETLIRMLTNVYLRPRQIPKELKTHDLQKSAKKQKSKKKAERLFNKSPTSVNLNNFRIFRAKARRIINQSKRKSWKDFVSTLSSHSPMIKVWNAIRKIKGKGSSKHYQH